MENDDAVQQAGCSYPREVISAYATLDQRTPNVSLFTGRTRALISSILPIVRVY